MSNIHRYKQAIKEVPKPPLSRLIREDLGDFCIKCGSSSERKGFLGLLGERLCINADCENSKSKFSK